MTRAEHLEWCKQRALRYVDAGELKDAVASFTSDVNKHPETATIDRDLLFMGLQILMFPAETTSEQQRAWQIRAWIQGFY